jgi:hypothetical protein
MTIMGSLGGIEAGLQELRRIRPLETCDVTVDDAHHVVAPTAAETLRIDHGGSNGGYQTETNLYLKSGDGGVVFTNATSGLLLFREVFSALADVRRWPPFGPPPKGLAQLSEAELKRSAGAYRIVSGIELPLLRTWIDGDRVLWEIPGLRLGVSEMLIDVNGVLFNHGIPFETHARFGPDGRVAVLEVFENDTCILAAERI